MSTTSQKHHTFISEPMGDKPVTDLAGVGEVLGKRLTENGYNKVYYYILINLFHLHFWAS